MEHEDADLLLEGVAEMARLLTGPLNGEGHFTKEIIGAGGRKREHVGGPILAEEVAVQAAQFAIVSEQAGETAARGQFFGKLFGEPPEAGAGQAAGSPAEKQK